MSGLYLAVHLTSATHATGASTQVGFYTVSASGEWELVTWFSTHLLPPHLLSTQIKGWVQGRKFAAIGLVCDSMLQPEYALALRHAFGVDPTCGTYVAAEHAAIRKGVYLELMPYSYPPLLLIPRPK